MTNITATLWRAINFEAENVYGKNKEFAVGFLLILEVVAVKESQAITCSAYQPATDTVTLPETFYAGNDLPVGSVIVNTLARH